MKKQKTPTGYKCPCGKKNKFSAWVYAHYDIRIRHTCECGRQNIIENFVYVETLNEIQTKNSHQN